MPFALESKVKDNQQCTDIELLFFAARAAGYPIHSDRWARRFSGGEESLSMGNNGAEWKPLKDDGDALRLAVKLGLTIASANGSNGDIVEVYTNSGLLGTSADGKAESHEDDPMQAVRRAIVRAAAEIGRTMP